MERKVNPTGLHSKFEDGEFGHVKIYLEPIIRVYKDKSGDKESDKIRYYNIKTLENCHESGWTY